MVVILITSDLVLLLVGPIGIIIIIKIIIVNIVIIVWLVDI